MRKSPHCVSAAVSGDDLPQLLIIRPSCLFRSYEHQFSAKFKLVKAYESPLPTHTFLEQHAHSVKALLTFLFSPVTEEVLRRLPSLKVIVSSGTGVDHIDLEACRRRGIAVANTADLFSEDTADYGVGLLLDVMRKISAGDHFVRRRLWPLTTDQCHPLGFKVGGKRVGIVGLGKIGSRVAKRLSALGCTISYNSRTKKPSLPYDFYPTALDLAFHCDILVICCSLSEETRHMINDDVLGALGKNGVIVNIGRGAIIDEEALVKRLMDGTICGAALDVFENEPNVPMELLRLDNVVLSPHRAVFTKEAFYEAFNIVTGNLEAFFSNKPLLSPVNTHE